MASLHVLLILCVCATALCLPTSSLTGIIDEDNKKDLDILDINEGKTEIDEDNGNDQDIFDINEGNAEIDEDNGNDQDIPDMNEGNEEIDEDNGNDQDISDVNKGNSEIDEDNGEDQDISDVNEGNAEIDEDNGNDQDVSDVNEGNAETDEDNGNDQDVSDVNEGNAEIDEDNRKDQDIPDVNEGKTETDEDNGNDQDISDVNEGNAEIDEDNGEDQDVSDVNEGNEEIDEDNGEDQDISDVNEGIAEIDEDNGKDQDIPDVNEGIAEIDEDNGNDQDVSDINEGIAEIDGDNGKDQDIPDVNEGNTEIDEDNGNDQDISDVNEGNTEIDEDNANDQDIPDVNEGNTEIDEDNGNDQDIPDMNEGNTEIDEDNGNDQDIFDINEAAGLNLVEGDILMHEGEDRNTISGAKYRWPTTVPYVLDKSLEINAKGVILKAFEQFRLKTCIDFKPRSKERNYVFVFKGSGCYSKVGNRHMGKQELSIGAKCDSLATVEHEFLHALGFWHEQSRSDRDDYVTIMWNQIQDGHKKNFELHKEMNSLGVPYDYGSVMHYSKTSFSKSGKPTIVTKLPEFLNVIGQRMEFSDSDLLKLNRLYNCTTTSTFLDSCHFEKPNICGMIKGYGGNAKWARVKMVKGGPKTDYTNLGQCRGGFFMHFNTAKGSRGHKAHLQTRLFYPKRHSQCLQFYHYNSGSVDDQLKIWVREYTVKNPKGALRLIRKISGGRQGSWELYHVKLNVSHKFRVVFEGVKGRKPSKGGLSLDDINLSETKCPQHTWRIRDFTRLLATTPAGSRTYSPRFLSPDGYSFQISLQINGLKDSPKKIKIYLHLTSGPNDKHLKWPCPWRQASMELMDQNPHIQHRMNNIKMITTDPAKTTIDSKGRVKYFWDNPRKVGSLVTDANGSKYYRGPGYNSSDFITHDRLKSRSFIKGNDVIFLLSLEDVTRLKTGQKTRKPKLRDLDIEIDDRDAEKEEPERLIINPRVPSDRTMD